MNQLKRELIAAIPKVAPIVTRIDDDDLDLLVSTIVAHISTVPALEACRDAWARLERANDETIVSRFAHRKATRQQQQRQPLTRKQRRRISLRGKVKRRKAKMEELEMELQRLEKEVGDSKWFVK